MKEIIDTLRGRRLRETSIFMRGAKKDTRILTIDGGDEHPRDYKYDLYLMTSYVRKGESFHRQVDLTKTHLAYLLQGKKLMFNDLNGTWTYSLIKEK